MPTSPDITRAGYIHQGRVVREVKLYEGGTDGGIVEYPANGKTFLEINPDDFVYIGNSDDGQLLEVVERLRAEIVEQLGGGGHYKVRFDSGDGEPIEALVILGKTGELEVGGGR